MGRHPFRYRRTAPPAASPSAGGAGQSAHSRNRALSANDTITGQRIASGEIELAALLVWQLAQLTGLIIAGLRAPLAAAYPQPAEFEAVPVLIACQFAWSSILLPALGRSWQTIVAMLASGWVMLLIAAALAGWPIIRVVPYGLFLLLWLACITVWVHALPRLRWRLIASALATTYVVGGIFVWYLGMDLGTRTNLGPSAAFGPLLGLLASPRRPTADNGLLLALLLAIGLMMAFIPRVRRVPFK